MQNTETPVRALLSAAAVRDRAHEMLEFALAGEVEGWSVDLGRMQATADLVASITRERFPTLDIPFHARWRHFVAGAPKLPENDPAERARAAFDLVILSVLLDAGTGPGWRYVDPVTGEPFTRSEGLAVASQRMFEAGALDDLAGLETETLAQGFQVSEDNPLAGLEGRAALLRRLGTQVAARPDLFVGGRLGGLYDVLAQDGGVPAPDILALLLEALGPIWADRLTLEGVPLGDCWRHPALRRADATDGLVPLHKLSQWLSYSLIEPLEEAGVAVTDIDGLTGLAEYRNGGLFVDIGVLTLADPADAARSHQVSDPLIVAWRAMTVALLDRLAPLVRERLGVGQAEFPLARMLEGGTWQAGRRIAAERRPGGGPPFNIISDGTVF
ncbi:MAG TPA: URC4/urg3 family protein [Allosphingosinicella sp.]